MLIDVRTVNSRYPDGHREMMIKLVFGACGEGKTWLPIWRWSDDGDVR